MLLVNSKYNANKYYNSLKFAATAIQEILQEDNISEILAILSARNIHNMTPLNIAILRDSQIFNLMMNILCQILEKEPKYADQVFEIFSTQDNLKNWNILHGAIYKNPKSIESILNIMKKFFQPDQIFQIFSAKNSSCVTVIDLAKGHQPNLVDLLQKLLA